MGECSIGRDCDIGSSAFGPFPGRVIRGLRNLSAGMWVKRVIWRVEVAWVSGGLLVVRNLRGLFPGCCVLARGCGGYG